MSQFCHRNLTLDTVQAPVVVLGGGLAGLTFTGAFAGMSNNLTTGDRSHPTALLLESRAELGGRANPEDVAYTDCLNGTEQLVLPITAPSIIGPEQVSSDHKTLQSLLPSGRRTKGNTNGRYIPQIWVYQNSSWNTVDNLKAQEQGWFWDAFVRLEAGVPSAGEACKLFSSKAYQEEILREYWDFTSGCYVQGFGARTFESTDLVKSLVDDLAKNGAFTKTSVSVTSIKRSNGLWEVMYTYGQVQAKALTEILVIATPSWKLRELQFKHRKIRRMLAHLSEVLPGTRWPAKVVVGLRSKIMMSGFNEYFLVGDGFCAQLWPHPRDQCALSGIISPIPDWELNLDAVYTNLNDFFSELGISLAGRIYILRVSEVFGGAYTFYPGQKAYIEKVQPVIQNLKNLGIILIGDYVDLDNFGHAEAAVQSAKKVAEELRAKFSQQGFESK